MTNTIHTIGVCGAGDTMGAGKAIVAAAERAEVRR